MDKYYMCLDCGWTVDNNTMRCKKCNSNNVADIGNGSIKHIDTETILEISRDKAFVESMCQLHDTDPIEFQLKLSQFKTNLATQDASEKIQDNTPKCPTCSSKKIKKISGVSKATSVALWGLFSQKVRRQWKCENCGYEW